MHDEDWHDRLEAWRRIAIARSASQAEHTEAAIEQERQLCETIRQIAPIAEWHTALSAADLEPVAGVIRDLEQMIDERLSMHRNDFAGMCDERLLRYPEDLSTDPVAVSPEPETLAYSLEAAALGRELMAATMRTTAAMLRARLLLERALGEGS